MFNKYIIAITLAIFMFLPLKLIITHIKPPQSPLKPPQSSLKIKPPPSSPPFPTSPRPIFNPTIKKGGKYLESRNRANAIRQLRGQGYVSEGVIIHEATHLLNSDLNFGKASYIQPGNGFYALYLWGEDQYLIMPMAGFTKGSVIKRIPMNTVSGFNVNIYFSSLYNSRDAIHIIEDFVAELNGFEADSPDLLRDMFIFSIALGLEMQQKGHEKIKQYQAGNKLLIERASEKPINLDAFKTSTDIKAITLKNYLKRTYGTEWTKQYLGI